jgi:Zn-dependent protease
MGDPTSNLKTFGYDINKYFGFEKAEIEGLIVAIIIMSVTVSCDKLFIDAPTFSELMINFLIATFNSFLIFTLSFAVYQTAQRLSAIRYGFKPEWRIWIYGLIIGLILAIVSRGKLWFLAPGGLIVYHMAGHRIGSFRAGLNYWPLGMAAIMGPMACVILAMIFKILSGVFPANPLILQAMYINIWLAVCNLIPIPPLEGSVMFFASRMVYIFAFAMAVGTAISLYFFNVWISLLIGFVAGIILWQVLYWTIEK